MGFIYTLSRSVNFQLSPLLSHIPGTLAKSDFPYKLTNKNTHAKKEQTFAGHSTPERNIHGIYDWQMYIHIHIHMSLHIYMYCCMCVCVCYFIYAVPVQKKVQRKCWIFNANIKQKIVFLSPRDLCGWFIFRYLYLSDAYLYNISSDKLWKMFKRLNEYFLINYTDNREYKIW